MSLKTKLRAGISAVKIGSVDFGRDTFQVEFPADTVMASGTAAGLADLVFADTRSIAASSNEELDLAGSLAMLGETLTFVKIKAIYIKAAAANGGNIIVGGASSNAFTGPFADATDKIEIPAGGFVMLAAPVAGWAVTAGTGDLLKVENDDSGAAGSYNIAIVGTSA